MQMLCTLWRASAGTPPPYNAGACRLARKLCVTTVPLHAAAVAASSQHRRSCRRREESGLGCDAVEGGTAWALLMAAQRRLPIYVFDDEVRGSSAQASSGRSGAVSSQRRRPFVPIPAAPQAGCPTCTRMWHAYDYASNRLLPLAGPEPCGQFGPLPTAPPQRFAGIGTRSLGPAGAPAIREVLQQCMRAKP